jgi:hypothetical protein
VDPTRLPAVDPGPPIWLSSGMISRLRADAYIRRLHLGPSHDLGTAVRVYEDRGQDHVGTATLAYRDDRIYRWLLSKSR